MFGGNPPKELPGKLLNNLLGDWVMFDVDKAGKVMVAQTNMVQMGKWVVTDPRTLVSRQNKNSVLNGEEKDSLNKKRVLKVIRSEWEASWNKMRLDHKIMFVE